MERLEMVQRRAVRFICNLKGVCCVTEARESLLLDSLENRRRESRKTLLCRIIASDTSSEALRSSFPDIQKDFSCAQHVTRSVSASILPAVTCDTNVYLQSFVPRTIRDIRHSV